MENNMMYYCDKCHRTMNPDNFYRSNNLTKYKDNDGYLHQCKKCLTMHVDNWNPDTFVGILEDIDVPWIPDEWNVLLQKYGRQGPDGRTNLTGTTIIGRYLSKMKLKQFRDYRWKDTEFLQEMAETRMRQSLARQGFEAADIEKAVAQGRIPAPNRPVWVEPNSQPISVGQSAEPGNGPAPYIPPNEGMAFAPSAAPVGMFNQPEEDLGLTDDDIKYLRIKWGSAYRQDEWVRLEELYNQMMESYEVQTAGHKDTLKLVCKASLKANQLLDIGDVDGAQKMMHSYDSLMKSGHFTAVQNKTEAGDYIDSISKLVEICESEGFIPRYYIDTPQDKVDWIIKDLQEYTHSLVTEEMGLGNMIETALQQIARDKEKEMVDTDDITSEDALDAALFEDGAGKELSVKDYQDFEEAQDEMRQEDEESLWH